MSRKATWIIGVVALGLAGWAAYQAAAAIVHPDRDGVQSLNRMSQLTSIEHARLEKDFQAFYSKPPAEQQRLREIHEALQGPGKQKVLRQISANFYLWYSEARPRQRDELRNETDVEKKLALVDAIQKEMDEQQADNEDSWSRGRGFPRRRLSEQELANVMQIVEDKLRDDPTAAAELDAIEAEPGGYDRYYAVMQVLLERMGDFRERDERAARFRRDFFIDERFASAVSNRGLRKTLTGEMEREPNPRQRPMMLWILAESLYAAYHDEIKKKEPTEEEMMEFFVKLPSDKQEELMWLSSDNFMRQLKKSFVHAHAERYPPDPGDLFRKFRTRGPRDGERRGKDDGFPGPPRNRSDRRPRNRPPDRD